MSIWHIDDLDGLLARGCDRLKNYLNIHPQVRDFAYSIKTKIANTLTLYKMPYLNEL
jgi:hypothetical protein